MVQDEVIFYGHPNVRSLHAKTIEITKDEHLTLRGDCIIGVQANKACADLNEVVKQRIKSDSAVVRIEVIIGDESFLINGMGNQQLTLLDPRDIVMRKTKFVCPRTLSIRCDRASSELPTKMVSMLQNRGTKGLFRVTVE